MLADASSQSPCGPGLVAGRLTRTGDGLFDVCDLATSQMAVNEKPPNRTVDLSLASSIEVLAVVPSHQRTAPSVLICTGIRGRSHARTPSSMGSDQPRPAGTGTSWDRLPCDSPGGESISPPVSVWEQPCSSTPKATISAGGKTSRSTFGGFHRECGIPKLSLRPARQSVRVKKGSPHFRNCCQAV